MRIAQIQGLVGGGGSEVHTSILCRGLQERGHQVLLCMPDLPHCQELGEQVSGHGVEVELFPCVPAWRRLIDIRRGIWLARKLRSFRADLVHTHIWNADVIGWFAARLTGVPVVATLHGPTVPVSTRKNHLHRLHHLVYARMLRQFDAIIAISDFVRRFAASDLAIPVDRMDVVLNCSEVDLYRDEVDVQAVRADCGVPDGVPSIMIVGELTPRKGILDFIEAAGLVHREAPEAHFVLVGRGVLEAPARERVAELGIAERVHFLGQRSDVPALLRSATLLAVTSYKEGFGRTITEAMSSELPVVSYDSGAPREIVVDGETGFLTREGDPGAFAEACLRVIRDPGLCKRMGAAGLRRAREVFDVAPFVEATERILLRTADLGGAPQP